MMAPLVTQTNSQTRPIDIGSGLTVGGSSVVMMAGPCSVESYEQTRQTAQAIAALGGRVLRGGAFKPRTAPDSFQGLGIEGLRILREVADEFNMLVITEALGVDNLDAVVEYADIIQIGSRNMQHFPLLWEVGGTSIPVLLKRGYMSTVEEWLAAAEHIASRGNEDIILCERGIRGFDNATRNVLDIGSIALVKAETSYPVIADPSHATGRVDLVVAAARAGVAAGADGLLVEAHPTPAEALSDSTQQLPLDHLPDLWIQVGRTAAAIDRELV
nr:3-deoxy-D-arabinoheptulosonate 7-phosphate synthase [uncultured bacterium]